MAEVEERGKRAGTENVAGIVGMAKAAEIAYGNMRKRVTKRNYASQLSDRACTARNSGYKIEWISHIRLPGNVRILV